MRWKRLSALIVISLIGPACVYAQSRPAQPKAPAPQSAAGSEQTTQVRAFGNVPQAKPGATGASGPAQSAAAPQVDPQLRADLLRLFALTHVMQGVQHGVQVMFRVMRPNVVRALPPTPHREQIADEVIRKMGGLLASREFRDRLVAVYAQYFNDRQVKALIQLVQSPAWQYYVSVEGRLRQGLQRAGEGFALEHVPAIYMGLCSEYPELQGKAKFCSSTPPEGPAPKGQR